MARFEVTITIENKQGLSDPEGQTILKDLMLKGKSLASDSPDCAPSHARISDVRVAKMLRITMDSADRDTATSEVRAMCDELHIYNPLVSVVGVTAEPLDNVDGTAAAG